ncbi:dynein regulatory complex protein 12 [Rhinophrynus dorsalis]
MPPKQKGKSQKKKGKKQKDGTGSVEEQYRRAALEVDILQEHLALRRQVTRRTQEHRHKLKMKLEELQGDLEGEKEDKQAIYSEMARQYRTLEEQSSVCIQALEKEVVELRLQLAKSQQALQDLREESERTKVEKEAKITQLRGEVESMESEYEALLHSCLDQLLSKLSVAELQWKGQALSIHQQHKQMLQDCGLNPLDL